MKLEDLTSIDQLTEFLAGTQAVAFSFISDYSRQQLTRWVGQYRKTGQLQRHQRTVSDFQQKYTAKNICLRVAIDKHHGTPCGPADKKLCEWGYVSRQLPWPIS